MCVCSFCYHLIANVIKSVFCYQLVTNDRLSVSRPNSGIIDASFEMPAVGKCVRSKHLVLAKVYKKQNDALRWWNAPLLMPLLLLLD